MTKSAKEREGQHYQHPPQSLQQSQTHQNVTAITTESEKSKVKEYISRHPADQQCAAWG